MTAQPGELLHGVIDGHTARSTDLDNALLYNIGGRVAAATRYGVMPERRPAAAAPIGARYRYRLTREAGLARSELGPSVVEFKGVEIGRQPKLWPDVWAAVRTSPAVHVLTSAPTGELALQLRIGAPRLAGAANGQFVKTLVDSVLTALHAHGDAGSAEEIGRRVSAQLALSAAQTTALLLSRERAALGTCDRLIVLGDRGIQCQPEDIRLAALRVEIDRSATVWSLSGRISLALGWSQ
jgi:hypothetical protein